MGYSNGQLESLSATGKGEKGDPGLPGIGFSLTDDGNFDIDSKRLTEVAAPIDKNDAATKEYVDDENTRQDIAINSKAEKTDVLLRDGTQSMLDNLNLNNHNIINLKDASENNEAVTFSQLKKMTDHVQVNYHLQPNMRFFKNYGNNAELTKLLLRPRLPSDHFMNNHFHDTINVVIKEGFNSGFGGEAWASLKMTNDSLTAGIYTVVFEIFSFAVYFLTDETLITQVKGDSNFNVITFSHDYNEQYTKAFIQFSSNGQPGEITFQIRYYGSKYNNNRLVFNFYSRVIAGKQNTNFNHNLLNVKSTDYCGTILYFEPINMNNQKIVNLSLPTDNKDAANKEYVDDEDAKQDIAINDLSSRKADRSEVLLLNGSQNMTGNLSMNGNRIFSLPIPTGPQQPVTKTYLESQIASIPQPDLSLYLKVDGSRAMTGDLNINDKKITDLATQDDVPISDYPNYVKDSKMAVNKLYVNENFLKLKGDDYDLKGKRIINTEPYGVNIFGINDLVSKAFVQAEISKLPTDVLPLDGSRAMTGTLQMGDHAITGIRSSSADDAALTAGGARSTYLPLSGDRGMEGYLDMGGNAIINIKPFVEDDSSPAVQNAQANDVINFRYFHGQRGQLKREINDVSAAALNRKNPDPMEDSIDMGNHSIINLKDPNSSDSFHASNVNYVNKTISDNNAVINSLIDDKISEAEVLNIKANRQENEFSFVMDDDLFREDDDDIVKVGKIDRDFYQINKAAYHFKIKYDSAIGYYSNRLSIDLRPLDLGEYTLAFEMYYNDRVDHDEVVVGAVSETLNVSLNNTNTFSDHSRTIINFHKYGNLGIIDLDIDLTLKYKSGNPYDSETDIYVVVYGVTGHQNEVDSRIWDRFYYIGNKIVYFEAPIDMSNHQIKRLAQGTENSDAINVRQLSIASNYLEGKIDKINEKIGTIDDNKNLIDLLINYLTKRLDLNTLK